MVRASIAAFFVVIVLVAFTGPEQVIESVDAGEYVAVPECVDGVCQFPQSEPVQESAVHYVSYTQPVRAFIARRPVRSFLGRVFCR